jgi:hypothetical protein
LVGKAGTDGTNGTNGTDGVTFTKTNSPSDLYLVLAIVAIIVAVASAVGSCLAIKKLKSQIKV